MVMKLKLDLGCGKQPVGDTFTGVDLVKWGKNVGQVVDLRKKWPWKSGSVDEVFSSRLVGYFTTNERAHFANELHRVLKPKAKAVIIVPHWSSSGSWGDHTLGTPVTEAWFYLLNRKWRSENMYWIKGYECDFECPPGIGYGWDQEIAPRNDEYKHHAAKFWREAVKDVIVTLTKG